MANGDGPPVNDKENSQAKEKEATEQAQKIKEMERAKQTQHAQDNAKSVANKENDSSSPKESKDKKGGEKNKLEKPDKEKNTEKREKGIEGKEQKKEVDQSNREIYDTGGKPDITGRKDKQTENPQIQDDKTKINKELTQTSLYANADKPDITKQNDSTDLRKESVEEEYYKMAAIKGQTNFNYEISTIERNSNLTDLPHNVLEDTIHTNQSQLEYYSTTAEKIPPGTIERLLNNEEILKEEWINRKNQIIDNESKIDDKNLVSTELDNNDTGQQKSDDVSQEKDITKTDTPEAVTKENIIELICEIGNCVSREQYSGIFENLNIYSAKNLYDDFLNNRVDAIKGILEFAGANKEGLLETGITPEDLDLLEKNLQTLEREQVERKIAIDTHIHEFSSVSLTKRFVRTLSTYEIEEAIRYIQEKLPHYNVTTDLRYDGTGQITNEIAETLNNNLSLLEGQLQRDKDGSEPIYNDFYVSPTIHLQDATARQILLFQSSHLNWMELRVNSLASNSFEEIKRFNENYRLGTIIELYSGADDVSAGEIDFNQWKFNGLRSDIKESLAEGNVEKAQRSLDIAQKLIDGWEEQLTDYTRDTVIGGKRAITTIKVIKIGADLAFSVTGGAQLKGTGFIIKVGGGALLGASDKFLQNTAMQISEVGFGLRNGMDYGMLRQQFGIDTLVGIATGTLSNSAKKWFMKTLSISKLPINTGKPN